MNKQTISTQPYKGTADLLPADLAAQQYIFSVWRKVCLSYGYKEYLTPTIELADIYRAKSGVVKDELFTLTDRAGRDLALRPEMTPSVTRLIASIYKEIPKPIRFFSIANFFRNEAPQKGRSREFWQLNYDIFGDDSLDADVEIMSVSIDIMLEFGATEQMFKLYFNNRILLDELFDLVEIPLDKKQAVGRIMDKYSKIGIAETEKLLTQLGLSANEPNNQVKKFSDFLQADISSLQQLFPALANSTGLKQINYINTSLKELGYERYFSFNPSVIRGFDYYDGTIYEMFDLNPQNNRSLFGGGRYNGLSEIFGVQNFPATGFAPGNVTTELFLKNWELLPQIVDNTYYLPILTNGKRTQILKLAKTLRSCNIRVQTSLSENTLTEALRFASKQGFKNIIIVGEDELNNNQITIKNMDSGNQKTYTVSDYLKDTLEN